MARKSSNVQKMLGVPSSVSSKVTPRLSASVGRSMPGSGSGNPMSAVKNKSIGKAGGTAC